MNLNDKQEERRGERCSSPVNFQYKIVIYWNI